MAYSGLLTALSRDYYRDMSHQYLIKTGVIATKVGNDRLFCLPVSELVKYVYMGATVVLAGGIGA